MWPKVIFILLLVNSIHPWTPVSQVIRRRNTSRSLAKNEDPSLNLALPRSTRTNESVRALMTLILQHFQEEKKNRVNPSTKEWHKTRTYLYHAHKNRIAETQVQKVLLFLNEAFPSNSTLQCHILQSSPRILRKNVKTHLAPTLLFLRSLYGEDLLPLALDRNPDLLLTRGTGYEADALDLVEVFLQKEFHLSKSCVKELQESAPTLFQCPLSKILSVTHFFQTVLLEAGVSQEKGNVMIGKVIVSHPNLLQLSVEANLKPSMHYIRDRCGLKQSDLAILLKSTCAGVLGLSITDKLGPTLDLLSSLAERDTDLRKAILVHPQLLGLSLKNLLTKVSYFAAIDHALQSPFQRRTALASRILARSPAVYSLSLRTNIIPKVEFLAGIWGLTAPTVDWHNHGDCSIRPTDESLEAIKAGPALALLLGEFPSILSLSLEGNLRPTVNFFNKTGYIHLDVNWKPINFDSRKVAPTLIRGRYLASSLFNRLLPRWHYYMSNYQRGVASKGSDKEDEPIIPLHALVSFSDSRFCEELSLDFDDFQQSKDNSIPRLKFSSQFDTWLKTGIPIDV